MNHFLDTKETIAEGMGFPYFGKYHLLWLCGIAVTIAVLCLIYIRSDKKRRLTIRRIIAMLTVADEIFKVVGLLIGGNFNASYLPLHLCSINIFLIVIHSFKPSKLLENYLYSFGIIPVAAALIFPATCSVLPPLNFMVIHSLSVHALILAYPLILLSAGELRRDPHEFPRCLLLLLGFAAIALCANAVFDTNFMFLREATTGNPLFIFKQLFGNHLWGYPILIVPLFLILYAPLLRHRRSRKITYNNL